MGRRSVSIENVTTKYPTILGRSREWWYSLEFPFPSLQFRKFSFRHMLLLPMHGTVSYFILCSTYNQWNISEPGFMPFVVLFPLSLFTPHDWASVLCKWKACACNQGMCLLLPASISLLIESSEQTKRFHRCGSDILFQIRKILKFTVK